MRSGRGLSSVVVGESALDVGVGSVALSRYWLFVAVVVCTSVTAGTTTGASDAMWASTSSLVMSQFRSSPAVLNASQ